MKTKNILAAMIIFCSFQPGEKKCSHNITVNADWSHQLSGGDYMFDSVSVHDNASYVENNITADEGDDKKSERIFYFHAGTVSNDPKDNTGKIRVVQAEFDNACYAKRNFDRDVSYFKSTEPNYDLNTGFYAGVLQDKSYYAVKGGNTSEGSNKDGRMNLFAAAFLKKLLPAGPEKNTMFIRFSNRKPIVK